MDIEDSPYQEAFSAIHDEALRLHDLVGVAGKEQELTEGLDLIMSLARHQYDVRTDQERRRAEEQA